MYESQLLSKKAVVTIYMSYSFNINESQLLYIWGTSTKYMWTQLLSKTYRHHIIHTAIHTDITSYTLPSILQLHHIHYHPYRHHIICTTIHTAITSYTQPPILQSHHIHYHPYCHHIIYTTIHTTITSYALLSILQSIIYTTIHTATISYTLQSILPSYHIQYHP